MEAGQQAMPDLIKLNGAAVSAVSFHKRDVAQPNGPAVEEYQIAVMIRGRMTNRSFVTLLQAGTIRLEVGSHSPRETTVTGASVASTGSGESAVYRHDFTLRETADSAAKRQAAAAVPDPKLAELAVFIKDAEQQEQAESESASSVDTWTTALQKLAASDPAATTATATVAPPSSVNGHGQAHAGTPPGPARPPGTPPPAPQPVAPPATLGETSLPPPPVSYLASPALTGQEISFSPIELAGIEAVLVGLRIETVIDALDRLEILPRAEIEQAFLRLVRERFVAEATLVVGEPIARRAARDILHGLGVGRWSLGDRR
jgi:hypothetical protein